MRTLLINQFDFQTDDTEHKVFFMIGNMDTVRELLLDNFNSLESKYYGKGMLKYNGLRLYITIKEIPEVIKMLVGLGVNIYGIYELYEPK
ncbi:MULTISPECIES: hypothetical protein [Peptoniphilus]|uniref:hypothetical protein n=1 Tax=Peptoniphilus TaxID=162289 RepID=UPI000318FA43|nr:MULTISPECIES: hypothetical protein [Peptoniphilus]